MASVVVIGPGAIGGVLAALARNGVDQERRVDGLVHPDATVLPAVVVLGAEAVDRGGSCTTASGGSPSRTARGRVDPEGCAGSRGVPLGEPGGQASVPSVR